MDAKSRANFINSVASKTTIPCPKCGTNNKPDSKFCFFCGTKIAVSKEVQNNTPAFEPVKEDTPTNNVDVEQNNKEVQNNAPAFEPVKEDTPTNSVDVEPNNVFAQGLPDWSLEPPQVMVRRR